MKYNFTGIVILNYNNPIDTENCVKLVIQFSKGVDFKILVVDNGSKDDLKQSLLNRLTKIDKNINIIGNECNNELSTLNVYFNATNSGYACGNNKGLKIIYNDKSIEYVLILNNDIKFTQNIIPTLISFLESHTQAAVVSPLLYKNNGHIDYECARKETNIKVLLGKLTILGRLKTFKNYMLNVKILSKNPDLLLQRYIEIDLPSGSCMLFKKSILEKIGGFDENTFLYYEEDILSIKFKKENLFSYLLPSVSCIHLGGNSIKKENNLFIKKIYDSSALYYAKNYLKISYPFYLLLYVYLKIKFIILKSRKELIKR